jgi:hypothetical protein
LYSFNDAPASNSIAKEVLLKFQGIPQTSSAIAQWLVFGWLLCFQESETIDAIKRFPAQSSPLMLLELVNLLRVLVIVTSFIMD